MYGADCPRGHMVGNMAKDHSITEGSGQILTQGDLVVVQGYRREVRE